MPDLKKTEVKVPLEITQITKADNNKASIDKMYIEFNLLYAGHSHVNKNGEGFVPENTADKVDTITNGYINIEHEGIFNVGTVISANYEDLEDGGMVESSGILWKSVMEQFGIKPENVKGEKYKISMEVLYKDFYYLKGDEVIESEGNNHLEDYIGQTYEGDYIARIIKPVEFSGCALTTSAAEQRATINKAVASKLDEYKEDLEEKSTAQNSNHKDIKDDDNQNSEGSDNMPYKEFETEKEFNEFKENLKSDEEFVNSIAGYVKVEDVLDKFNEVDLEEVDDLDSLVASVKEVKDNYKDLQARVEANKVLRKRVAALSEIGVEFDEEEMDKEELVNMSEAAFKMWKKTIKKVKESNASNDDDNNDDDDKGTTNFDPNMKIKSDGDYGKVLKNL